MNIKQLATFTGLTPYTIRYYEKIGLILDVKRNSSGYRLYTKQDLEWVQSLIMLKDFGMSLKDIKLCAKLRKQGCTTICERIKIFEKHHDKIKKEMQRLQKAAEEMNKKITSCKLSLNQK